METRLFILKAIAVQMCVGFFPMPWKGRVGLFREHPHWSAITVGVLMLALTARRISPPVAAACVLVGVLHWLIRQFPLWFVLGGKREGARERFAAADAMLCGGLAVGVAMLAGYLLVPTPVQNRYVSFVYRTNWPLDRPDIYAWAIGYAFSLGFASVIIGKLLAALQKEDSQEQAMPDVNTAPPGGKSDPGIRYAGRLIGFFEAFIVTTLVALGQWAAIGFLVAAKAIGRIKQLEQRAFAEYFLIGTLANVSASIIGGMLVRWLGAGG
ncbi:MAG TPA: hypothetical protein VM223_08950 [Planctomycetota bacterium]|nr:hypothetical protein [Planctomycetota bacterium]